MPDLATGMKERLANAILLAITSFLLMVACVFLHERIFNLAQYTQGIDLFYFPSGVRLLLLMIGGAAAAVGIALANLLNIQSELGISGVAQTVFGAFYTAFVTLFSLWFTLRIMRVDRSLKTLSPLHLLWICLGTAVGSSVLHNAYFFAIAPTPPATLALNTLAMTAGDFLGSLVVVYVLWLLIRLYRAVL